MPKLIKPFHLGLAYRTLLLPPKKLLVVSVFGFFDFDKGPELELEQKMWPLVTQQIGERAVLDMGAPKLRGEVLLGGKAVAPAGRPVDRLVMGVKMLSIQKRLLAVGQRYWRPSMFGSYEMTRPAPFVECPLDFGASFGGPKFPRNPSGKGHAARSLLAAGQIAPLPILEDPVRPISGIDDAPEPVSFGQMGPDWPQRSQYAGTYDAAWAAARWPAPPADMRLDVYNAAPRDQQIEGFFRGDERFTLEGMNAWEQVLHGQLPRVYGRCFLKMGASPLVEAPMRLDTVWLFGVAKKGVVIFRGVKEVADSDAADVSHILVSYENLSDPRRDPAYYEDVFRKRTDPETGHEHILLDPELGPVVPPDELERRVAARVKLGEEKRDAFDRTIQANMDKTLKDSGQDLQSLRARIAEYAPEVDVPLVSPRKAGAVIPMITPGDIERVDIDLGGILRVAEQQQREAMAEAEKAKAQAEEARRDAEAKAREQGIALTTDKEPEQRRRVERQAGPTPAGALDINQFLSLLGQDVSPDVRAKTEEGLGKIGQSMDDLGEARRMSPEPIDVQERLLPSVGAYFGELVRDGLRQGRSYHGRDLADADFRGADLRGVDFGGCFLERANLEGAVLAGADLSRAVLTGANLRGANLSGAALQEANLSKVDASDADFSGANLDAAMLMNAKLTGARLTGARMNDVQALSVDLTGARLDGAELRRATLLQACIERANADGADLTEASLLQARATGATFRNAKLEKTVLVGAVVDDACFDGAQMPDLMAGSGASFARTSFRGVFAPRAGFHGAILDNASFERAILDAADLGDTKLRRARLSQASMKQAILMGADLRDAVLRNANLFEAMLRKANLDRADLEHASLYNALLDETTFADARLAHVTTGKARLPRSTP